jgi:hypothetical protein
VAQAIRNVKGVLRSKASYRKKAAFVQTKENMCNRNGLQQIMAGLTKSKKYKGKLFSMKLVTPKGSKEIKLAPIPKAVPKRAVPKRAVPRAAPRVIPRPSTRPTTRPTKR